MSFNVDRVTYSLGPSPKSWRDMEDCLLFWKVRCINRQTRTLFHRELALDTKSLPPEEGQAVLMLTSSFPADVRITAYRHLFREVNADELKALFAQPRSMSTVSVDGYYEDEEGKPTDKIGVMAVLTGQSNPLIVGDVVSVLRIGPVGLRQKDKWSAAKANSISHFLRLIERIAASQWWRSDLSISYWAQPGSTEQPQGPVQPADWKHPNLQATREVLLSIRQLYASDDAFNFACNDYLQHVDHEWKRFWVKERKAMFNKTRSSEAHFLKIGNYTTQEILDLVLYGCGEVHRQSDDNTEERFRDAVKRHGFPHVYTAFGFAVRELVGYASQVYHVVKQDFDHWLATQDVAGPDRLGLDELHGMK